MEKYIKYKRFEKDVNGHKDIQKFLDTISSEGWDIIHYMENVKDTFSLSIVIIGGKKQSNVL